MLDLAYHITFLHRTFSHWVIINSFCFVHLSLVLEVGFLCVALAIQKPSFVDQAGLEPKTPLVPAFASCVLRLEACVATTWL